MRITLLFVQMLVLFFSSIVFAEGDCRDGKFDFDELVRRLPPGEIDLKLEAANQGASSRIRKCNTVTGCGNWSQVDPSSKIVYRHDGSYPPIPIDKFGNELKGIIVQIVDASAKLMTFSTTGGGVWTMETGPVRSGEMLWLRANGDYDGILRADRIGSLEFYAYQIRGTITGSCFKFSKQISEEPRLDGTYMEGEFSFWGELR